MTQHTAGAGRRVRLGSQPFPLPRLAASCKGDDRLGSRLNAILLACDDEKKRRMWQCRAVAIMKVEQLFSDVGVMA